MFERYTERARLAIAHAQDESRRMKHEQIGSGHILLGLLREGEGLAARVLEEHELTIEDVRMAIRRIMGEGEEMAVGQIPMTPRSKKILELALREALSLGHNYIGTEHILLGLIREKEGVAATVLAEREITEQAIRDTVIRMLSGPGRQRQAKGTTEGHVVTPTVVREKILEALSNLEIVAAYQRGWNEGYEAGAREAMASANPEGWTA